jgi:hypothetical protein
MKKLLILFILSLVVIGCSDIQLKRTTLMDGSQGFLAKCSGFGIDWDTCYQSANNVCGIGNYNVSDRTQTISGEGFVNRALYFSCK